MSSTHPASQPTPERIFDLINAHQNSAALKAGVELTSSQPLAKGTTIPPASRSVAKPPSAACAFFAIIWPSPACLQRLAIPTLAPDAAMFLDRRSPASMATLPTFLLSPMMIGSFQDLAAAVRKGGTVISEHGSMEPENPIWVEFARSMAPMMAFPAQLIAQLLNASEGKKWKVLDIAAGHGLFGIALAKHNPNAEIYALDWSAVLEVAKENAAAAGVSSRYHTLPGSAFDVDFGSGNDVVLLTNFLHHFDVPTCEKLLRRIHASLAPGGRVVTLEMVPNEDRLTPTMAAKFSIIMLASTVSGDAYTFSQYQSMFKNAGFSSCEFHTPPIGEQIVLAVK